MGSFYVFLLFKCPTLFTALFLESALWPLISFGFCAITVSASDYKSSVSEKKQSEKSKT